MRERRWQPFEQLAKTARATLHYGGRSPVSGAWDAKLYSLCRGPKDPRDEKCVVFPVGGDLVNPRYWRSSF
jgi:hypothetical protein